MLRPTIMRNYIFEFKELSSRPSIPVLLGWRVKNTDTLLKIHPVEFRVLSEALVRFLGSQFVFCSNQPVSPGGSDF